MDRITALLLAAVLAAVYAQEFHPQSPGTVIKIGGRCESNASCAIANAFCLNNACACLDGFREFEANTEGVKKSVCAKALSEQCTNDNQCFTNAKCKEDVCNCDTDQGYIPSKDSTRCLHKSNGLNSSCENAFQCPDWGDGTTCSNSMCTCQPEYHFYQEKCYYSSKIGEACSSTDLKKRCYLPADGNNQHVTCKENNKCECVKGYKPSDDQRKCKIKPFDGSCESDDDCTEAYGKQSECSHNKCICKAEHHLYNNSCCFNLALGDQCNIIGIQDHCHLPLDGDQQHVECGSSGKCQCSHGYKPAKNNQQCVSGSPATASISAFLLSAVILLKLSSF